MDLSRGRTRLCEEALVLEHVFRTEIDARYCVSARLWQKPPAHPQICHKDETKVWRENEAVLSPVILTPWGAAILGKSSKWTDGGEPAARARAKVCGTFSRGYLNRRTATSSDGPRFCTSGASAARFWRAGPMARGRT